MQNKLGIRQIQTKYISDLDVPLHMEPYKCWVLYVMFILLSLSFIVFFFVNQFKTIVKIFILISDFKT